VVDNVTAGGAAAAVTKPLPGCGAQNDAGWIMYAAIGAGV